MGLDDLDSLFSKDERQELNNLFSEGDAIRDNASAGSTHPQRDLSFFCRIPVNVTLEVASVQLPLGDLMKVGEGHVIALDKAVGEPLDIKVNGRLFAKGEVVMVNGKYGLRLVDILDEQVLSGQSF